MKSKKLDSTNAVIVSPDVGGTRRARRIAKHLNIKIALLEHRNLENDTKVTNVVGDLAETAVIVDDMIDTGSRLITAAETLKKSGVKTVYACCSHAVFSGNIDDLQKSDVDEVVVTDSIKIPQSKMFPKVHVHSVAPLLAEAIRRIHNEEALGSLFGVDSL